MKKLILCLGLLILNTNFSAQTLNPTPSISGSGSADNFKGGYTFAYITSGTPWDGALLSFGGFNNNYDTQLNASYFHSSLSFRTRNGDTGTWNNWVELASKKSNHFIGDQTIDGSVGIGTNSPQAKLDVNGNIRINNNADYTFLTLGKQANDQIIVDNHPQKAYGGGYFFRVHNDSNPNSYLDALVIADNGNVGIGVNAPQNRLDVAGKSSFSDNMKVNAKIEAQEVKVTQTPTADFVFEEDYALPALEDVEHHIKEKKHLPEIASAKEMEKEGVNVGEFQIKLLQKIEELTLYSIEQNKKINKLVEENKLLKQNSEKITELEEQLKVLTSLINKK